MMEVPLYLPRVPFKNRNNEKKPSIVDYESEDEKTKKKHSEPLENLAAFWMRYSLVPPNDYCIRV